LVGCGEKLRLLGDKVAAGRGGVSPVPTIPSTWLPGETLSLNRRLPLSVPVALGVKATSRLHPCPMASEVGQPSVALKSPLVTTPERDSGALPRFVKAIVVGELEVPTTCGPKVT